MVNFWHQICLLHRTYCSKFIRIAFLPNVVVVQRSFGLLRYLDIAINELAVKMARGFFDTLQENNLLDGSPLDWVPSVLQLLSNPSSSARREKEHQAPHESGRGTNITVSANPDIAYLMKELKLDAEEVVKNAIALLRKQTLQSSR